MKSPLRARARLLLVVLLFLAPFVAALVLRFSGWEPPRTRNVGELLQPPVAAGDLVLRRADGAAYAWRPTERIFRIAAFAPEGCIDGDCGATLELLSRVWESQGRHADHLELLWFGPLPADAPGFAGLVPMQAAPELRERVPAGTDSLYVLDPRGFVVLRYPPGFDPSGLRRDLARLLK